MQAQSAPASIVLSLDFELRWGLLDLLGDDPNAYRANLEGVEEVVPRLLESFAKRGVRATWATVGALACDGWAEWRERTPELPRYDDVKLRWRESFRTIDPKGRLYFAPKLVDAIANAEDQELASHTFNHVYLREPGFTRADAVADTEAIAKIFEARFGETPKSLVFPRNQVAHTDVLEEHGVSAWRTNPTPFYWNATAGAEQTRLVRGLRFADSIAPLGWRRAPAATQRASYFMRLTLPKPLFEMHRRRIARDAKKLRPGETLHLWCHPHNLGGSPAACVARLEDLVDAAKDAAPLGTRFASMNDLAAISRAD